MALSAWASSPLHERVKHEHVLHLLKRLLCALLSATGYGCAGDYSLGSEYLEISLMGERTTKTLCSCFHGLTSLPLMASLFIFPLILSSASQSLTAAHKEEGGSLLDRLIVLILLWCILVSLWRFHNAAVPIFNCRFDWLIDWLVYRVTKQLRLWATPQLSFPFPAGISLFPIRFVVVGFRLALPDKKPKLLRTTQIDQDSFF